MLREAIYVCTYRVGDDERVAHVRAWDASEAAERVTQELESEDEDRGAVAREVRVRAVLRRASGG